MVPLNTSGNMSCRRKEGRTWEETGNVELRENRQRQKCQREMEEMTQKNSLIALAFCDIQH
jgi:hypothetical protein